MNEIEVSDQPLNSASTIFLCSNFKFHINY